MLLSSTSTDCNTVAWRKVETKRVLSAGARWMIAATHLTQSLPGIPDAVEPPFMQLSIKPDDYSKVSNVNLYP